MSVDKKYLFYAEISKGYILKVIIDTLVSALPRGYFVINKEGIKLRQSDQGKTILFNIDLPRKSFRPYVCREESVISVNLKHMQSLLKNVKKKDSIAVFRVKDAPRKITIEIKPEGGKKNARVETNSIVCQIEGDYKMVDIPAGDYSYPMVIEATDFQKIKRLTTTGKVIDLEMQRDNYLLFKCDQGVVLDSELKFGRLVKSFDNDGDNIRCYCKKFTEECDCVCKKINLLCPKPSSKKGCGEHIQECECVCNKCDEYIEDCQCILENTEYPGFYQAQYYSTMMSKLVKIPGLCTQMQFYAPGVADFPLKIEADAGQGAFMLGTVEVYIKDIRQILYEESLANDQIEPEVKKPAKGRKKK